MSPWVLILMMGGGWSGGPVAIDMPDAVTCQRALEEVVQQTDTLRMPNPRLRLAAAGFCISREPSR